MILWGLSISASAALLVLTAALRPEGVHMAYAHMLIAAAVCICIALLYIKDNSALRKAGAGPSALAALTARYMGTVWSWAALALAVTYATNILTWREWPHFLAASIVVAGLCLLFAAMLQKDANAGREDATMLRLGRILTWVQLVGVSLAVVGLLIDGKMTRFMTLRYTDWAANNVFFFGALAIAAISAHALRTRAA